MKTIAAIALAVLPLSALPAQAYIASNGLVVESRGGNEFTVPYRGRSGPGDFWCAAGDYVVQRLGLPYNTRIYRISPPPRRSGEGITFSLSSDRAAATGLAVVGGSGKGLSAVFAQTYCDDDGPLFGD